MVDQDRSGEGSHLLLVIQRIVEVQRKQHQMLHLQTRIRHNIKLEIEL